MLACLPSNAQWQLGDSFGGNPPLLSNYLQISENHRGSSSSYFPSFGKAVSMGFNATKWYGNIGFRMDAAYNLGGGFQGDKIISNTSGDHYIKARISGNHISFAPMLIIKQKNIYIYIYIYIYIL
ncbi:MAG: hypothetical protein SGJ10_05310, partial [Bacteroidota bacterium]|nr:hypothetical protein [Bacteroidota bacterium]